MKLKATIHRTTGMLRLNGGDPAGRDSTHRTICSWPGWRRLTARGTAHDGTPCSIFEAFPYVHTVMPLTRSTFAVEWEQDAKDLVLRRLSAWSLGKRATENDHKPQPVWPSTLPTARAPMPHQMRAIEAIQHWDYRCLLADDMGLGKTSTALWCVMTSLRRRLLVICPASVKFNWLREAKDTLGELRSWVIDGTPQKRRELWTDLRASMDLGHAAQPLLTVINYDLLPHLKDDEFELLLRYTDRQAVIADESHYIKSVKAKRTKLSRELLHNAHVRLLLTGTPIRNTVEDLYSQIEAILPRAWSTYSDFCTRHLVQVPTEFNGRKVMVVRGARDIPGLNAVVNTVQVARHKSEVISLPPKIHTFPDIEMDDLTKRLYSTMKRFATLALDAIGPETNVFEPQARSAVEMAMRCEQIAQGFVGGLDAALAEQLDGKALSKAQKIPGRPNELAFPSSAKLAWVIETIEDLISVGRRPILYSRFNAPLFFLQTLFPDGKLLHGGVASQTRHDIVDSFQAGDVPVLLAQVGVAEGWTATRSQDVIFLGRDWSPAKNAQAEDRAYRIGTTGTVNVYIPIVRDSIEAFIHQRLAAKDSDAQQALANITVAELRDAL